MAMEWATKRRIIYASSILGFFALIGTIVYFTKYYDPPSCFDKIKNQDEEGVDCGGMCNVVCLQAITQPIVLWSRTFQVARGVYSAVAYIENPNIGLGTAEAVYHFKLYDEDNILVSEVFGRAFISPNEKFAVIEPRISTGQRVPVRAFFEFLSYSSWIKEPKEKPLMIVRGEKASNTQTSPRVDAILQNGTIFDIPNVDITAIVYDKNENAIAASATIAEVLPKDSSLNLVFTWPMPFRTEVARIEVIPRLNMFTK
jgi:hypothetical protein